MLLPLAIDTVVRQTNMLPLSPPLVVDAVSSLQKGLPLLPPLAIDAVIARTLIRKRSKCTSVLKKVPKLSVLPTKDRRIKNVSVERQEAVFEFEDYNGV